MSGRAGRLPDDAPLSFRRAIHGLADSTGIPWPRLESGALALDDDTFPPDGQDAPARGAAAGAAAYPRGNATVRRPGCWTRWSQPLPTLTVSARSSRNQPSNAKFIFGPSCWLRSLIQPAPGRAVAYVDWSQQEFGIAAALSGDVAMMDAYASGDPYLRFAIQAEPFRLMRRRRVIRHERELFKTCALGVAYGMQEEVLARRIDQPPCVARELLRLHRETYPTFWRWSEAAVDHAMLHGTLRTVFGWTIHVGPGANPRVPGKLPDAGQRRRHAAAGLLPGDGAGDSSLRTDPRCGAGGGIGRRHRRGRDRDPSGHGRGQPGCPERLRVAIRCEDRPPPGTVLGPERAANVGFRSKHSGGSATGGEESMEPEYPPTSGRVPRLGTRYLCEPGHMHLCQAGTPVKSRVLCIVL